MADYQLGSMAGGLLCGWGPGIAGGSAISKGTGVGVATDEYTNLCSWGILHEILDLVTRHFHRWMMKQLY